MAGLLHHIYGEVIGRFIATFGSIGKALGGLSRGSLL